MDLERALRSTPFTASMVFKNGNTSIVADGNVTVTVYRADGTMLASGTASLAGTTYSYILASQTNLNNLTLAWTGTFSGQTITTKSYVEIVDSFYFTLSELRNYDAQLSDVVRFPDNALYTARLEVETEFEDICKRAFVGRFMREEAVSVGDSYLRLKKPEPFAVTKLVVDGVDRLSWVTSGYVTYDIDSPFMLNLTSDALAILYASKVECEYEYGMKVTPFKIKRAGLKRAKGNLLGLTSAIDERATTLSIPEVGTMTLALPNEDRTGIPDIDATLWRHHLSRVFGGGGVY